MAKKKYDELAKLTEMFDKTEETNIDNKKEKQEEKKIKESLEEEKTLKSLINDYSNSELIFTKQYLYVSDKVKDIIDAVSKILNKSSKQLTDSIILKFYTENKDLILKEYKDFQKKEKEKLM